MKYALYFGPDTLHIDLQGTFTFKDSKAFHTLLMAIKSEHGHTDVRIDIHQLNFIDSTALGLLMEAFDMAKYCHRALTFVQPTGQVQEALSRAAKHNAIHFAA